MLQLHLELRQLSLNSHVYVEKALWFVISCRVLSYNSLQSAVCLSKIHKIKGCCNNVRYSVLLGSSHLLLNNFKLCFHCLNNIIIIWAPELSVVVVLCLSWWVHIYYINISCFMREELVWAGAVLLLDKVCYFINKLFSREGCFIHKFLW